MKEEIVKILKYPLIILTLSAVLPSNFTLSSILDDISKFTKDLKIQEMSIGKEQFTVKMMQEKIEDISKKLESETKIKTLKKGIKEQEFQNKMKEFSKSMDELSMISNQASNKTLYGNYNLGDISINKSEIKDIFGYSTIKELGSYTLKKDITLQETNGYQSLVNPNTYIIKANKTIFIKSIYKNADQFDLVVSW